MMSSSSPLMEISNLPSRSSCIDLAEGLVARARHHVVQAEVALAHGRQDAHQHRLQVDLRGGLARLLHQLVELPLHAREAIARQRLRIAVRLELEQAELGGEVIVVQTLRASRGRPAPGPRPDRPGTSPARRRCAARRSRTDPPSACARARADPRESRAVNSRRCCASLSGSTALCDLVVVIPSPVSLGPFGRGTAAASCAKSPSRGASRGPTSRLGWGCPATQRVRHRPRLADVLGATLAAAHQDEARAQHVEVPAGQASARSGAATTPRTRR